MHWTDHNIRAMGCVVEKFDLHTQHLQNVISTTANVKYRAKLEGETCKTSRCKVIVVLCPFHRCFSRNKILQAEKSIIDVVEAVKNTKKNCWRLLRYEEKDPGLILKLPTLKLIIDHAEANKDDEPHYQFVKLKYFFVKNTLLIIIYLFISQTQYKLTNISIQI